MAPWYVMVKRIICGLCRGESCIRPNQGEYKIRPYKRLPHTLVIIENILEQIPHKYLVHITAQGTLSK